MNASRGTHSENATDWVAEALASYGDWAPNDDTQYAAPSYERPIIFGSVPSYLMSVYSQLLVDNLYENASFGWDFVPFGSEGLLTEFVVDMYEQRLPFIANIYSPHTDFALRLSLSSFERRKGGGDVQHRGCVHRRGDEV